MRSVDVYISNLDTTPDQEDELVDQLWQIVARLHPDADMSVVSGPDPALTEK